MRPLPILVSTRTLEQHAQGIASALADVPHQLLTPEHPDALQAQVAFVSRDVTGLSTKHEILPETQHFYDLMTAAPQLRWVHVHSAGVDRQVYVDLMAQGVALTTSAGSNAEVVAQTAVAGILALGRRFPELWQAQQQQRWSPLIQRPLPTDLQGQTATIVGWGGIGQSVARILSAVGMRIQVVRSSAARTETGWQSHAYEDLSAVLPTTDWLVLACPLTDRTQRLVDAQALRHLPAGASVVNVSRGDVLDEPALIAALQSGHLGGAYLDVFAHEPLPSSSVLWSLPNVIATPHSAGFSAGNAQRVVQIFLDNLRAYAHHQPLRNLVPREGAQ